MRNAEETTDTKKVIKIAWFKVDDGFHSSRKLLSIPKRHRLAAAGLWAVAGSWCADQLTDGHIPDYMFKEWGATPALVSALVDSGLWEHTCGSHLFANWLEYQPSKQDVDAEREASRARMRDLRARRKQRKPQDSNENKDVFGRTVTNSSENVRNPDPSRPDPTLISTKDIDQPQAVDRVRITKFEDFWAAYPRKVGKQKAKTKYTTQAKAHGEQIILDGVHRFRADPNLPMDQNFIPHATTWLERGSWADEPLPPRSSGTESQATKNLAEVMSWDTPPDDDWLQIEGQ